MGLIDQWGQDSLKFINELKENTQKSLLRSPKARYFLKKASRTVDDVKNQSQVELQKIADKLHLAEFKKRAAAEIQSGAQKLVDLLAEKSNKTISEELKAEMVELLTKAKDAGQKIPSNLLYVNKLVSGSLSPKWDDVKNFKTKILDKLIEDAQKNLEAKKHQVNAAVDQVAETVAHAAASTARHVSQAADGLKERTFKRGDRRPNQTASGAGKGTQPPEA